MKTLIVILLLTGLAICQNPSLNFCANPPKTPPKPLSGKIVLDHNYKISGSMTDWSSSQTSLLMESFVTNKYRVLERQTRGQVSERWVQDLTGPRVTTMFVNVTSGECNGEAPSFELFNVTRFEAVVGNDTSSIASIIKGLSEFAKLQKGFDVEPQEIVGGVSATKWVACVDAVNDTKLLVEVRYASDSAISPAVNSFENPLILSIRLAELDSFNSSGAHNHLSIEFDRYEMPTGDEFSLEHGIICANRPASTEIPWGNMDEYAAQLNYFNYAINKSEVVDVLYSKSRKLFIVAGGSFDEGVSILNGPPSLYSGSDYILHDFKYGYEFTTLRGACTGFSTLPKSSADVNHVTANGTLTMKPMTDLLISKIYGWETYKDEVDMFGNRHKTFRGNNTLDSTIGELYLTDNGDLHSMAVYRKGTRELASTLTATRFPIESSRLYTGIDAVQASICYASRDEGKFSNNTWIVPIRDKALKDLKKIGTHRLNEAVATSMNKVYPIIPYRIDISWVENLDGGISMTLRLAEKTEVQPAPVGYNFTEELPTAEFFQRMNASMIVDKMPIVFEVNGTKEEWMADGSAMRSFPQKNDSGFLGYTGGAMFVLAIFCLLIGTSIGAVGVFVATRRQRISTLAYQVFE